MRVRPGRARAPALRWVGGFVAIALGAGCGEDAEGLGGAGGAGGAASSSEVATGTASGEGGAPAADGGGGAGGGLPLDNGVTVVTSEESAGNPAWRIVDWNIALGSTDVIEAAWPLHADRGLSTEPHPPPYDHEVSANLLAAGYDSGNHFSAANWVPRGASIFLLANVVPNDDAPLGRSLDFEEGPIIPSETWYFQSDVWLFRDGAQVAHDGSDAPRGEIPGVYENYGRSHIPLLAWFDAVQEDWYGQPGAYQLLVEVHINDDSYTTYLDFTVE